MHLRIFFLALFALLAGCATDGSPAALLDSLGDQLSSMRTLPVNTATNARCPKGTDALVGESISNLKRALGEPDFIDRQDNSWWYFFTSPRPVLQFGGGFPQLGFKFGQDGLVSGASCYYAR